LDETGIKMLVGIPPTWRFEPAGSGFELPYPLRARHIVHSIRALTPYMPFCGPRTIADKS